jgi:hypothetical protein
MPEFPHLSSDQKVKAIQEMGGTLPKHELRKKIAAWESYNLATSDPSGPDSLHNTIKDMRANRALASEFSRNRRVSSINKTAAGGGDYIAAIPRFYDPVEYWELSGIPWNIQNDTHRQKLYQWLRLYYMTHYLVPILIDIFTRFPLVGMELSSKDPKLTQWYEDLFFDRLDYQEFLVRLGREYWTVGQAFPLGSFNDTLGIWEREELINPEDVVLKQYPLLGTQQFEIKPPEFLKELAAKKSPMTDYNTLLQDWPELIPYLIKNENIPVSNVLMKQVAFKINDWDIHGTPLLLRGLRTLMHEEKLLASQDAIAERLYSPLILAKLGIQDIGDGVPWMPGPDECEAFRDDLDIALASDFRVLVHHFGVDIQNVFGREQMPNLGDDFDRIERRLMQLFGVNPSLLSAGSNAQPYASSALQAEFLNQILRTYQNFLKRHFMERARVVAEANEHYDYEQRGDTRVPIMEEHIEYDEEGNIMVVERHKLLIPEINMKVLDLRDEATQRQFLAQLKASGVPISDQTFMVGLPYTFKEELGRFEEEAIEKTVAQQEAKVKIYRLLKAQNLPIPPDLLQEIMLSGLDPNAGLDPSQFPGMDEGMVPGGDMMPPAEGEGDEGAPQQVPGGIIVPPEPGGTTPAAQPIGATPGSMPEVSNERTPIQPPGGRSSMSKVLEEKDGRLVERINRPKNAKKISLIRDDILPNKEKDDNISNEDEKNK